MEENVYTCGCGNQTFTVLDNAVRCTACNHLFAIQNTPVMEFNHTVTEKVQALEEV